MAKICEHGMTDNCRITSKTVVEDFIHGTRCVTIGYFCLDHRLAGHVDHKESIPATANWASLGHESPV